MLLTRLGGAPLWDDDEPKNAACSLAMLDSGDWVVPTFNGQLRVEKPPLVNWLHIAGMTLAGRNETGVRLGSAVLTIGTCLLTWRIGTILATPAVGLVSGVVMATCVWTAVGGRAATPDAPLVFFTTLALFLFARDAFRPGRERGPLRLAPLTAIGIGAACGAAVLAKGPVGFVLPCVAMGGFAAWHGWEHSRRAWFAGILGLRPLTMFTVLLAVTLPWYAAVTIRTDGEWLRGFVLVHNVGRFAAPMEGHSGSILYYPLVICCGLFPWSMVLAAMVAHVACILRAPHDARRPPCQLLACWAFAWIGGFSLAGTKLPGYVWPAYPALAIGTGMFLDACLRCDLAFLDLFRRRDRGLDLVIKAGWSTLAVGGAIIAVGLPLAARRWSPGAEWLGAIGLVPLVCAAIGWRAASPLQWHRAFAVLAVTACAMTTLLATVGAERIGRAATPKALFTAAGGGDAAGAWLPSADTLACFPTTPPSLVFYAGGRVAKLDHADAVAAHLSGTQDAHLVVDSRFEQVVLPAVPAGHGVLARVATVSARSLVLIGPLPRPSVNRLAADHRGR